MIEAVEVVRDKEGGFTHPEWLTLLCALDDIEDIPAYIIQLFEKVHGCNIVPVTFESTVDEDCAAWVEYYDDGVSFGSWALESPRADAVLLSVHDTESGPVQLWAVPVHNALESCPMHGLERPRLVTHHAVSANGRGDMGQAVIAHGQYSPGGAQNHYLIGVGSEVELLAGNAMVLGSISFQDGSPQKVGPNGVTLEAVLACCADRIERFQQGPHANANNAEALQHILYGLSHLKSRTLIRDKGGR